MAAWLEEYRDAGGRLGERLRENRTLADLTVMERTVRILLDLVQSDTMLLSDRKMRALFNAEG